MKRYALVPAVALLFAACADMPTVPEAADLPNLASDPPPPSYDGETFFIASVLPAIVSSYLPTTSQEWLNFKPQDNNPLPAFIRQELKAEGASCGFELTYPFDPILCDISSTAQGAIFVKNPDSPTAVTDGKGLAYGITDCDLETVPTPPCDPNMPFKVFTVALDQFDGPGDKLQCFFFSSGFFAECTTDQAFFVDEWLLSGVDPKTGQGIYTRVPNLPAQFTFFGDQDRTEGCDFEGDPDCFVEDPCGDFPCVEGSVVASRALFDSPSRVRGIKATLRP